MDKLDQIKSLILHDQVDYSQKVQEQLEEDLFAEQDLAHSILTATRIYKRERDEKAQAADGYKYTILGKDTHGHPFYSAGKILKDHLGNYYFFITAHASD